MNQITLLQEAIINIMKDECGCKPRWLYSNPGWNQLEWLEATFLELTTPEEELVRQGQSWFEEMFPTQVEVHEDAAWLIQEKLETKE